MVNYLLGSVRFESVALESGKLTFQINTVCSEVLERFSTFGFFFCRLNLCLTNVAGYVHSPLTPLSLTGRSLQSIPLHIALPRGEWSDSIHFADEFQVNSCIFASKLRSTVNKNRDIKVSFFSFAVFPRCSLLFFLQSNFLRSIFVQSSARRKLVCAN